MHLKAQGENISQLLILGHSNVQLSMCYFFFKRFKNIFFSSSSSFWATLYTLVCFLASPTPTAIPTMTHRPEEDKFGVSVVVFFFSEIESTHRKYNEVSWTPCYQEHTTVVSKTNYSKPFSFCAFFFSSHSSYLPVPLWHVCLTTA